MVHREVIAHRGSSAYAPENTMPAFELALRQDAGCVEHDLQVTRDGVLVCLHDSTLERTTNVADVFPDRAREVPERRRIVRRWFAHDFTLADIRRLDAGEWFGQRFAGTTVATFDELLEWSRGRIAVLTEIKDVEVYQPLGIDPLSLCVEALRRHGYASPAASPVVVQSFHEPWVRGARQLLPRTVPVALLIEPSDAALVGDQHRVAGIARFADGIGPGKAIVADRPEIVGWAHAAGLRVTPWTFRTGRAGGFEAVSAEIRHHLDDLHVDAVITDHPDAYQART
jgi:glycerophosphoryl diester phosphodiesterase